MTDNNTKIKEETISDVLNSLNISKEDTYNLLLWNDHVNTMDYVVIALYDVCELSAEDSIKIMMEAHLKGKAVAKSGSEKDMLKYKQALNDRNIDATVERN